MSEPGVTPWTQPYDSTFKGLLDDQPEAMLSFFLGKPVMEAYELKEALLKQDTVQPTLRVDAAYLIKHSDWRRMGSYVAHIEFETSPNTELRGRLVEYFGMLYRKHQQSIMQVVVCPFVCANLPVSPVRLSIYEEQITEHKYRVMALWQHSVEELLARQWIELYALLPTMKGATAEVLIAALWQMRAFYQGQESRFHRHLLWFDTFLRRTTMVTAEDKERTWQAMSEFESLLDEGYFVQKRVAEATARGQALGEARAAEAEARAAEAEARAVEAEARGEAEGEARGLHQALVTVIELRFPALVEVVQQKSPEFKEPAVLKVLVQGLKTAPDEQAARLLLDAAA